MVMVDRFSSAVSGGGVCVCACV